MSVVFDAAADRLLRTATVLNTNNAWSASFWVYPADLGAYETIFCTNNNAGNEIEYIGFDDTAGNPRLILVVDGGSGGYSEIAGTRLTPNTWNHIAVVRASNTSFILYLNGSTTADITLTASIATRTTPTRMEFGALTTGNTDRFAGRVANVKIWDTNLTAAELAQEALTLRPQRTANLWSWAPLWSATDVADYSGNGRDWTASGLTSEDGPPASYGAPAIWPPYAAAAGGTEYTQDTSGALTPAAALLKLTQTAKTGSLTPSAALTRAARPLLGGALTPAATLTRAIATNLAGSLTPSAALAAVRTVLASMSGSLTPAGALIRQTATSAAGALTPVATLIRQTAHTLAGALTPAGALASVRTFLQSVSGVLTPAAALTRQTRTALSGVVALAGALTRRTATALTGSITPSGALAAIRAVFVSISGALTPAGTVVRQTAAGLAGALTPVGGLAKHIATALGGALSAVGALVAALVGGGDTLVRAHIAHVPPARRTATIPARDAATLTARRTATVPEED